MQHGSSNPDIGAGSGGSTAGPTTEPTLTQRQQAAALGLTWEQYLAIQQISNALPPNVREGGVQLSPYEWLDTSTGLVYYYEPNGNSSPNWRKGTIAESKATLDAVAAPGGSGGGGGGGSTQQLASDDPRYWANQDRQFALDVAALQAQLQNNGLDAESARRQALTTLITNRNNTATDVAGISNDVAKTAAQFAANPSDAFAELFYRNQVGGATPFGDMTNNNFGEYGKALADKAAQIFSPVQSDLNQARLYRDSIPPVDFLGVDQRGQLGLPPTPAQQLSGDVAMQPVGAGVPAPAGTVDPLTALTDRLKAFTPQQQENFRKYVTGGAYQPVPKMDMGGVINARTAVGEAPTSSEGGLNLNLFEPAQVVGMDSGRVYATIAEPRPDGTRRGEQLIVKPLKSEVEKDRKLADGKKAVTQTFGVPKMADGGSVTASPDDLMAQLSQYLGSLGGSGGGTGAYSTPLPNIRQLAGAPWAALEDDPVAMDYALAGYSAQGIDPRTVAATVKKFTPKSAQLFGQTAPRVSF